MAPGQYTGNQVQVTLADLSVIQIHEASVNIDEGKSQSLKVLVLKDDAPDILLGTDHPLTYALLRPAEVLPQCASDPKPVDSHVEVCAITRAQSQAQSRKRVADKEAEANDMATPKSLPAVAIPTQPKPRGKRGRKPKYTGPTAILNQPPSAASELSDDVVGNPVVVSSSTSPIEEGAGVEAVSDEEVVEEDGSSVQMDEVDCPLGRECDGDEACNLPIPTLCDGREEARALAAQQQEDGRLSELRKWGDEQVKGYSFDENGVLIHTKYEDPGREFIRIVVPSPRKNISLMWPTGD